MPLKIEHGVATDAAKIVIYGTEGVGKTSLVSKFPKPLILDTEDGSKRIDVPRHRVKNWLDLCGALLELAGNPQGFQTVAIDTVDWAETLLTRSMVAKDGKKSIEDYGFGKGWTKLAEEFSKLFGLCDQIVARGVNVVLVGHSTKKRVAPPELDDGYDRYELKLSPKISALVKEWPDALLFATYRLRVVEGEDGRTRAKGGKERVVHCEHSAAWDAKNRFGLPAEIPMAIDALAPIFSGPIGPHQPTVTIAQALKVNDEMIFQGDDEDDQAAGEAAQAEADSEEDPGDGERLAEEIAVYIDKATSERTLDKLAIRIAELESEGQLTADERKDLTKRSGRKRAQLAKRTKATA